MLVVIVIILFKSKLHHNVNASATISVKFSVSSVMIILAKNK